LLRELTQKKIKYQKEEEEATLEKIREKTRRIREAWEKHKGKSQEPREHYEGELHCQTHPPLLTFIL
jgi:hypothetical protein